MRIRNKTTKKKTLNLLLRMTSMKTILMSLKEKGNLLVSRKRSNITKVMKNMIITTSDMLLKMMTISVKQKKMKAFLTKMPKANRSTQL